MNVVPTRLDGVLVVEPDVFTDERGFFTESYHAERYTREAGLPRFVQDNLAGSRRGVLRGLHYQWPRPQGKLVSVLRGAILDVCVDIRPDSPTFRAWLSFELSDDNRRQLYVPEGFAHGYATLTDDVLCLYKCTDVYVPENDRVVRWDDPELGIEWPLDQPVLSAKDAGAPLLAELPERALPRGTGGEPGPASPGESGAASSGEPRKARRPPEA